MKLKYAYGIVPGNLNAGQEPDCKNQVRLFRENDVTVITLAGSAGVKESSEQDAAKEAEEAALFVSERFEELYSSKNKSIRPESACGLMFVAVKGNQYLAGQLGSGLIGRLDGSGSVFPLHETETRDELRIYKGELEEPIGFILLSEGACSSLYEAGTGNLSPACGTFFEWLKEYDGDTVSDALEENIRKYFKRDIKGDISVALLIPEQNREEPVSVMDGGDDEPGVAPAGSEAVPPGNSAGENKKRRKPLKYLIVALIILAAIYAVALRQFDVAEKKDDQSKEEPKPPVSYTENSYEPSVSFSAENPEAYDPGEYQAGVDIPAGEYFFWTGEMLKPNSIFVNDDTCLSGELYCMTVRLNEWDTLVSEYRFTSAENVNPIKPTEGILLSGKYKIGKDIQPGTYRVSPADQDTEGRYYSLLDEEISNDKKFSEDTTVVVPEEGYIVFYHSVLIVEGDY